MHVLKLLQGEYIFEWTIPLVLHYFVYLWHSTLLIHVLCGKTF